MTNLRFVLVLGLFAANVAHADDKGDAQVEMEKAQENLDRGEFDAAISRFNVARSLVPSSSGPYLGLGLAYARSGRCNQAISYLEEYLRRKKQNPKSEASQMLAECRSHAVAPTGRIVVTSEPSGAEVRFDDVQGPIVGVTPYESQPTSPGRHRVFVAKSGFRGASSEVVVNAGERATFTVALVPESAGPPPRVVRAAPPPPVVETPIVPGKLIVDVKPVDASVVVNGNKVASATHHYEGPQVAGEYHILVEQDGYRSVATTVNLASGGSERRELTLQPLKRPLWLGVGVGFTLVALGAGVGAIATYVLADNKPRDTHGYQSDKTASVALQGVFYPSLAIAAVGYIVWGVINRGRVADGPPLRVQLAPLKGGGTVGAEVVF